MLKLMVLQHAVSDHEARNWIWLQDQSKLTYEALLSNCQLLNSCCEQFQKAKDKDQANLTSITTTASTSSSIHNAKKTKETILQQQKPQEIQQITQAMHNAEQQVQIQPIP